MSYVERDPSGASHAVSACSFESVSRTAAVVTRSKNDAGIFAAAYRTVHGEQAKRHVGGVAEELPPDEGKGSVPRSPPITDHGPHAPTSLRRSLDASACAAAILPLVRRVVTLIAVSFSVALLIACGGDGEGGTGGSRGTRSTRPLSASITEGIATFYDADGAGNCSFAKSPGDLDVVALALPEYNDSAACGACLQVSGPKGDVTVRVVDSCPGCEGSGVSLDLSAQAFAKIAEPKQGRVKVSYRLVSCATAGNVAYHFKEGSSKYWTAIQVRNHRVPIKSVEYRKSGAWVAMNREDYNYFVEAKGVGDQPSGLALRVTATDGQVIEDTIAGGVQAQKTVTGTKQFE